MVHIIGSGRALPAECLSAETLDAQLKLPIGYLQKETGVSHRYVCRDESQIDLAVSACKSALEDAGIDATDIDLLISGCAVPYQPIPSMAPLVMRELGITDGSAAAFDVNSTCLSFLTALQTADRLLDTGQHTNALVFSSEIASRALPWSTEPEVAGLFGDGAAAVVLTQNSNGTRGLKSVLFRTYPSAYEASEIGAGGTRFDFREERDAFERNTMFSMDGIALFRLTIEHFNACVDGLLDQAGWQHKDVDLVIPHQASPAALSHMVRLTKFEKDRVFDIASDHGNQIAASIPFAFDLARKQGRIETGAKVLFLGTSAGVSIGGIAYEA
ncbi:MAG: 3-oxoacyl-[acyl-carrier-protein] synthase III C-terminal domain-containing protein [Paracoccaceae bacterium]